MIQTLSRAAWRLAWLWLVVAIAGCGGSASNQLKLEPVSGTVTLDGKPCSGVTVNFIPKGSMPGRGAGGYTDKAGKYELATTPGGKGAPVGEYRVTVIKLVRPDGSDHPAGAQRGPTDPPVFPVEYSGPGGSPLTATVRVGPNTIDFQLSASNAPSGPLRH